MLNHQRAHTAAPHCGSHCHQLRVFCNTPVSVAQDLNNFPNNAYLDADGNGQLTWTRQWYRLGNKTAAVQLRRHLVPHEADWRPGLGFLVRSQPSAFEVHPSVNRSLVDGAGPLTLLPSSDSSQFPSTCSSLPLVFGCSNGVLTSCEA